jgi:hypothetical protein
MNAMRQFISLGVLAAVGAGAASCGTVSRTGSSPVYLIVDSMTASQGGAPGSSVVGGNGTFLQSDVITNGSVFDDTGTVVLRTAMKDVTGTFAPSTNNDVTISRYHVSYRRADGQNTQGVDVPYGFDGAVTGTIPAGGTLTLGFELVRHDAKMEPPLAALVNNPQIITTIADVTFYGRDTVGNDINTTGSIQVDFGNFADPKSSN